MINRGKMNVVGVLVELGGVEQVQRPVRPTKNEHPGGPTGNTIVRLWLGMHLQFRQRHAMESFPANLLTA